MRMKGRLFVFEGPDGVGKSELSLRFTERLARAGVSCEHLAFPGHSEATLGKLVHGIHHDSARFGIERMTATSLQLLHVAAMLTRSNLGSCPRCSAVEALFSIATGGPPWYMEPPPESPWTSYGHSSGRNGLYGKKSPQQQRT